MKLINNLMKHLKVYYSIFLHIDKKIGILLFYNFIKLRLSNNKKKEKYYTYKHNIIKNYLYNNYKYIYDKYKNYDNEFHSSKDSNPYPQTIWIYWDDDNNLPSIVSRCIKQAQKYNPEYNVRLVSYTNFTQYCDIPSYIIEKYQTKKISKTHFSDIIRIYLLKNYGGMYMDATILQTNYLPQSYFSYDFFSIKINLNDNAIISQGRWCVFFIICKANNICMNILWELMTEYWKKETVIIDYLWLDYFLDICYEHLPQIKKIIDQIPYSNKDIFLINKNINSKFSKETYLNTFKRKDTYLFKMSYKSINKVPEFLDNKIPSIKWFIINQDI
ncbi:capsular polysaccharide synthesis protein [Phocaeicola coprocola]|jgi:hypothetical protein|uniref:capsular polysaccharide synthesis protein n=1 Tax=Phocaeicola coprocola TaxID=310298 RepID=UPI003979135B